MSNLLKGAVVCVCIAILMVALFGCASTQMNEDEVFDCELITNSYGNDEVFCE